MKAKLKYLLIVGGLRLLAIMPLGLLYLLSDAMYQVVYHLIGYRRRTVRDNLSRSFPGRSWGDVVQIEKRFYHHFCDCIVETIKLLHISDAEIDKRIRVQNGEWMERLASDGRPIILYLGHYGNWEWVQAITRHYRHPSINGEIYRPLHDKVMDKVMLKIRSRFPTLAIPQKQAFRTLLKMKQEGQQFLIGFIADQRPNSNNLNHWTLFLNQDTAYSVGGDEIGRRINAHFAYLEVEKLKRGYYRMNFKPIVPEQLDGTYPYTLQFMKMLEDTINRQPEYWLWSHKRWRIRRSVD